MIYTLVERLRQEANATEELHPGDSEIAVMREAALRIEALEGVMLDAGAYANNPNATSWSGLLDILGDGFPERDAT